MQDEKEKDGVPAVMAQRRRLLVFIAILSVALICVLSFLLWPKSTATSKGISFASTAWLESYIEKSMPIVGRDFYQSCAVSYTESGTTVTVIYATQTTMESLRTQLQELLTDYQETGENTIGQTNVQGLYKGLPIKVQSYFSEICYVIEMQLTPDPTMQQQLAQTIAAAYPLDIVAGISPLTPLTTNTVYGGYVLFNYNSLDAFKYAEIPLFSRAFTYADSAANYNDILDTLRNTYPDNTLSPDGIFYCKLDAHLLSIGRVENTAGTFIMINAQTIPEKVKLK